MTPITTTTYYHIVGGLNLFNGRICEKKKCGGKNISSKRLKLKKKKNNKKLKKMLARVRFFLLFFEKLFGSLVSGES